MKDKRQKATNVKCKREESLTKKSIFVDYSILKKKHLSFAGALWQMNTTLYQNQPFLTKQENTVSMPLSLFNAFINS